MKTFLLVTISVFIVCQLSFSQSVGIGTTTPHASAILHVDAGSNTNKGLLVTGSDNVPGTVPNPGFGSRLMFYPGRSVFRAGYASGTSWDNANVGSYSAAMGFSTKASGIASTALGESTTASGASSTALGNSTIASGDYSIAMGFTTTASGIYSIAMGRNTTANGDYSTAMGYRVGTNNQKGTFVIGDSDPNNEGPALAGIPDLFVARFWNGYFLFTSGVATNIGVALNHNGNAWVSVCDENRKKISNR